MSGDKGAEGSSQGVSRPPGGSAAAGSRTVFLSYASADAVVANQVCHALEAQGLSCWMAPRDVKPGAQYADAIVRAINDSKALVLVLSQNAVASLHVGKEVERASSKRKQIIALKIDAAPLTPALEYFLSESQWIDVPALGMTAALARLAEAVGQGSKLSSSGDPGLGGDASDHSAVKRASGTANAPEHGHGLPIKIPFLEQLKRRNVGRVALLYIGVCYLILEFFSTFLHVLALPEWTGRTLAALMVAGFPVVLIVAWIFELTPQGIKPAAEVDINPSSRKLTGRRLDFAIIIVLVLALCYFAADKFWIYKRTESQTARAPIAEVQSAATPPAPLIPEKSIAVLPFTDMSERKDQEYFADGLSEELIDMLTKIPDLRVPARTSSFYFKGKSEDIPTIARRLMVAHVLEGSVRKSGMYLRITAQLVRADNGYHLWSQTYDRKLDDIFKVQDEIAGAVVSALKVSLADSGALKVTTVKNSEAYTLYLQGRAINRIASNKQQFDSAAEYMRKAIKADPTFAKAWAWLASVLANEIEIGLVLSDAVAAEMRGASERALALDPNLADARAAKGDIYFHIDWDWEAAAAEFQKAYDLDPTDANNATAFATILFKLHGASDTVVSLYQRAIELDPLNPIGYLGLGSYYLWTGRLLEGETAFRKAIEIEPAQSNDHASLASLLLLRGEAAAGLAEFQRVADESVQRNGVAEAYFALGRRAEANAKLSEMERLDATTNAAGIGETFAFRGEIDQAFVWYDRAYQQHEAALESINQDPLLKSLQGDPRWKAFLRKMKLPELPE